MKVNQLLMLILVILITSKSNAQQNVYKCVQNGQITYSNDEKDNKCKQVEIKELNTFNPSNKKTISDKDSLIKNNSSKQEIYPEPIPLNYVPEKPAPIDEKQENKKLYEQKIKQIEQSYLNFLGKALRLKKE